MRGFVFIPVLVVTFLGIVTGVYLVQEKTHFLSKAFLEKNVFNTSSNSKISESISDRTINYPSSSLNPSVNNSSSNFISVIQRLQQRQTNNLPSLPMPTQNKSLSKPLPFATATLVPRANVTPTPSPSPFLQTPVPTSKPKPICSVLVVPSNSGISPYSASVCVGNNSNPYQNIQEELVDYNGDGSWDYRGQSYGCHSYTFQSPGTYYPKAKIVGTSGISSDFCQTTAYISAPTPTPTPVKIVGNSCTISNVSGATFSQTYQSQNGLYYLYYINSGATANISVNVDPSGAFVNWKIVSNSSNLPNGGSLSYPNSNSTSVVNWTAPINPVNTDEGVDIRGDISEYPNPWKYCPTITFAVRPG